MSSAKYCWEETETALQRCSYKKVFWKYAADLQENTMPKCDFNKVAKHTSA